VDLNGLTAWFSGDFDGTEAVVHVHDRRTYSVELRVTDSKSASTTSSPRSSSISREPPTGFSRDRQRLFLDHDVSRGRQTAIHSFFSTACDRTPKKRPTEPASRPLSWTVSSLPHCFRTVKQLPHPLIQTVLGPSRAARFSASAADHELPVFWLENPTHTPPMRRQRRRTNKVVPPRSPQTVNLNASPRSSYPSYIPGHRLSIQQRQRPHRFRDGDGRDRGREFRWLSGPSPQRSAGPPTYTFFQARGPGRGAASPQTTPSRRPTDNDVPPRTFTPCAKEVLSGFATRYGVHAVDSAAPRS